MAADRVSTHERHHSSERTLFYARGCADSGHTEWLLRSARAPHDSLSIADSSLYAYARNQVRTSRSRKMSWRF